MPHIGREVLIGTWLGDRQTCGSPGSDSGLAVASLSVAVVAGGFGRCLVGELARRRRATLGPFCASSIAAGVAPRARPPAHRWFGSVTGSGYARSALATTRLASPAMPALARGDGRWSTGWSSAGPRRCPDVGLAVDPGAQRPAAAGAQAPRSLNCGGSPKNCSWNQ